MPLPFHLCAEIMHWMWQSNRAVDTSFHEYCRFYCMCCCGRIEKDSFVLSVFTGLMITGSCVTVQRTHVSRLIWITPLRLPLVLFYLHESPNGNWFQAFLMSHIHMLFALELIIPFVWLTLSKKPLCLIEWPKITILIGKVKISLTRVLHTIIMLDMVLFDD